MPNNNKIKKNRGSKKLKTTVYVNPIDWEYFTNEMVKIKCSDFKILLGGINNG